MRLKNLVLVPLFGLLAACAFTPEKVSLNPTVAVHKSNIGKHHRVSVRVIDTRENTRLGGRLSGYGPAASITLGSDIQGVVKKLVYRHLRANNFRPVAEDATRHLTVRITGLQYQSYVGFWAGYVDLSAAVEVVAANQQHSTDKVFRSQASHATLFTPSTSTDMRNINAVFSGVMNKVFADKAWMRLLAKN